MSIPCVTILTEEQPIYGGKLIQYGKYGNHNLQTMSMAKDQLLAKLDPRKADNEFVKYEWRIPQCECPIVNPNTMSHPLMHGCDEQGRWCLFFKVKHYKNATHFVITVMQRFRGVANYWMIQNSKGLCMDGPLTEKAIRRLKALGNGIEIGLFKLMTI